MWNKVGVVVAAVTLLLGGAAWLNEVHSLTQANARELQLVREYNRTVISIDKRLSRIEGHLGVLGD